MGNAKDIAAIGDFIGELRIEHSGCILSSEHKILFFGGIARSVRAGVQHQQAIGGNGLPLELGQCIAPAPARLLLRREQCRALESDAVEINDQCHADDIF